jgi:hypothetical protein
VGTVRRKQPSTTRQGRGPVSRGWCLLPSPLSGRGWFSLSLSLLPGGDVTVGADADADATAAASGFPVPASILLLSCGGERELGSTGTRLRVITLLVSYQFSWPSLSFPTLSLACGWRCFHTHSIPAWLLTVLSLLEPVPGRWATAMADGAYNSKCPVTVKGVCSRPSQGRAVDKLALEFDTEYPHGPCK